MFDFDLVSLNMDKDGHKQTKWCLNQVEALVVVVEVHMVQNCWKLLITGVGDPGF